MPADMKNAISVDVEDWFCTHNMSQAIRREDWNQCELRAGKSSRRVLALLDRHGTQATFFVLGWIAERLPELVRDIERRGHEIAAHGYSHQLLTQISPEEFEEDLKKALDALKKCGVQQDIIGFRAPSFTMVEGTKWALPILERYGIKYDSSVFPVGFHPDYGIGDAPLAPYKITDGLYEFPLSCVELLGRRFPCSGGGYFRIFPYAYTKYCIGKCNALGRPVVFYVHPWELDAEQPRVKLPWLKSFRHYHNLKKVEARLDRLLGDFQFTTVRNVLGL